jgi:hypothetical protein
MPTMPRLRESTATGGRDWRGYPQWWALPLDRSLLPADPSLPLRVRIENEGPDRLLLASDRFAEEERVYEGPSFGEWPHAVPLKLEYDADYRIPIRRPLESLSTRSFVIDADGRRRPVRAIHRIRLIVLSANEGFLRWESAPLPRAPRVALGFAAISGERGQAEMVADGASLLTFPLDAEGDFDREQGAYRLCYRAEAPRGENRYGSYFLIGPLGSPGRAVELEVRFRTGMSGERMLFVLDRHRDPRHTAALFPRCAPPSGIPLVDGAARVTDATHNNYPEDTGRWTVASVY